MTKWVFVFLPFLILGTAWGLSESLLSSFEKLTAGCGLLAEFIFGKFGGGEHLLILFAVLATAGFSLMIFVDFVAGFALVLIYRLFLAVESAVGVVFEDSRLQNVIFPLVSIRLLLFELFLNLPNHFIIVFRLQVLTPRSHFRLRLSSFLLALPTFHKDYRLIRLR